MQTLTMKKIDIDKEFLNYLNEKGGMVSIFDITAPAGNIYRAFSKKDYERKKQEFIRERLEKGIYIIKNGEYYGKT